MPIASADCKSATLLIKHDRKSGHGRYFQATQRGLKSFWPCSYLTELLTLGWPSGQPETQEPWRLAPMSRFLSRCPGGLGTKSSFPHRGQGIGQRQEPEAVGWSSWVWPWPTVGPLAFLNLSFSSAWWRWLYLPFPLRTVTVKWERRCESFL